MSQSLTIQEALKVAIDAEINAYNLYKSTSEKVKNPGSKKLLVELAAQEEGHRKALEKVVANEDVEILGRAIPQNSRGIFEFLVETELSDNASVQEVMIFAMKEEQKAFDFYTTLKSQFSGTELEDLFERLATEERGHKIKLEDDYEEHFMSEN